MTSTISHFRPFPFTRSCVTNQIRKEIMIIVIIFIEVGKFTKISNKTPMKLFLE